MNKLQGSLVLKSEQVKKLKNCLNNEKEVRLCFGDVEIKLLPYQASFNTSRHTFTGGVIDEYSVDLSLYQLFEIDPKKHK